MVLATVVVCQALAAMWLWRRGRVDGQHLPVVQQQGNPLPALFPHVDFRRLYPGMNEGEIDQLQREGIAVRFLFAPFVQFEPMPVTGRFVEVTPAGFRRGRGEQPWPPRDEDLVVFVFGGSTTFSYGLPGGESLVSALQDELARLDSPGRVECYNFGRGYYFSTQERILFEQLLLQGVRPDVAVFIDGLNDFFFWDGRPWLTAELSAFMAPDLTSPAEMLDTEAARAAAVDSMLTRYGRNARLTEAVACEHSVSVLFVGQPVPFFDFPRNSNTDPFGAVFGGHELCAWGYPRFREEALAGQFGRSFIWCGDAFAGASTPMFVDSIHYSAEGARQLATTIVERAANRRLLPDRQSGSR